MQRGIPLYLNYVNVVKVGAGETQGLLVSTIHVKHNSDTGITDYYKSFFISLFITLYEL